MSDAESGFREWRFYVQDMIEFCESVLSYTEGLDQRTFVADRRTYDATLRNLELIGEAATHLPHEVREAHGDIPWHAIVGTRNRLAHGYLHISDHVIRGGSSRCGCRGCQAREDQADLIAAREIPLGARGVGGELSV